MYTDVTATVMAERDLSKLREENRRLREDIMLLRRQIGDIIAGLDEERSLSIETPTAEILQALPERFTVEDLIEQSEAADANVFQAYHAVKYLLRVDLVEMEGESFVKTPALTAFLRDA